MGSRNRYVVGNTVQVEFLAKDINGNLVIPTTVTFIKSSPSGDYDEEVITPDDTIDNPSDGRYIYTPAAFDTDIGIWHVRVEGEGTTSCAIEDYYEILASVIPPIE